MALVVFFGFEGAHALNIPQRISPRAREFNAVVVGVVEAVTSDASKGTREPRSLSPSRGEAVWPFRVQANRRPAALSEENSPETTQSFKGSSSSWGDRELSRALRERFR